MIARVYLCPRRSKNSEPEVISLMGYFIKRLIPLTAALCLFIVPGFPGPAASEDAPPIPPEAEAYYREVVARVNGVEITRRELLNAINALLPMQAYHTSVSEERYE